MGLAKRKMHQIFLAALGDSVVGHSRIDKVPLEVDLRPPLPVMLRVYMYTATHPPGGRTLGEHKIQLIMPEHKDKLRANFDHSGGRIVLLVGYEPELLVFILWDAGLYKDFPFSRNVQVKPTTVYQAAAGQIGVEERRLWVGSEQVVTIREDNLCEGLLRRQELTLQRLTGD